MEGKVMSEKRQYDNEYKVQAVKLSKKIGSAKAAKELGIPVNTLYGWISTRKSILQKEKKMI